MQALDLLPGYTSNDAWGISSDHSVVVGYSWYPPNDRATAWDASGRVQDLGVLPGATSSFASCISSSGEIVAGWSGGKAVRWLAPDVVENIDTLFVQSLARGVSGDATVIVGSGWPDWDPNHFEHVFRWTASDGMVDLGGGPQQQYRAHATNHDGTVIVGTAYSIGADSWAFVWNPRMGIVSLAEVLATLGVDIGGWVLGEATGVSGDGQIIVGTGLNRRGEVEGWIANVCALSIATQPESQTANTGSTATLFVSIVVADAPAAFLWHRDGEDVRDGGNIFGATTDTLTIDPVTMADAGIYDVVVSNACGSVTSNPATLTVICFGDVALPADGFVNVIDLLALIYEWGHCPGCQHDLTGDNWVNVNDLLELIGAWGPCP